MFCEFTYLCFSVCWCNRVWQPQHMEPIMRPDYRGLLVFIHLQPGARASVRAPMPLPIFLSLSGHSTLIFAV